MIASLPMYDRAETRGANDRLWSAVRTRLGFGPSGLSRDGDVWEIWRHPDLVLAQTCGLPYAIALHDRVQLVGQPDFRLPDCVAGQYYSVVVARRDDDQSIAAHLSARPVINEDLSQSGHAVLRALARTHGVSLERAARSGSHRASAQMVALNEADIAAIDANTWRMIDRWDDFAKGLKVVAKTPPTAAMPFICGPKVDSDRVASALEEAIHSMAEKDREALGLFGLAPADHTALMSLQEASKG